MGIFLVGAVPLFYLAVNSLFKNEKILLKSRIVPLLGGILLSVPAFLLLWIFNTAYRLKLTYFSVYWGSFLGRIGFFSLYIAVVAILYLFLNRETIRKTRFRELAGYFCGFFFAVGIRLILIRENSYGSVEFFVIPLTSMTTIAVFAFLLSRAFQQNRMLYKILYAAGAVLFPFALNFLFTMSFYHRNPLIVLISALLFLGSCALVYLETEDAIPGGL